MQERYIDVVVREMLLALAYLHRMNVIHRDLKAANVLITAIGKVMLCDFGVSGELVNSVAGTFTGTSLYMAVSVLSLRTARDALAHLP